MLINLKVLSKLDPCWRYSFLETSPFKQIKQVLVKLISVWLASPRTIQLSWNKSGSLSFEVDYSVEIGNMRA